MCCVFSSFALRLHSDRLGFNIHYKAEICRAGVVWVYTNQPEHYHHLVFLTCISASQLAQYWAAQTGHTQGNESPGGEIDGVCVEFLVSLVVTTK